LGGADSATAGATHVPAVRFDIDPVPDYILGMSSAQLRGENWIERSLFALNCALLAWALLEQLVPAHPVEGSRTSLVLSAAMVFATGAPLIRHPAARRLTMLISFSLLVVVFWML
jgi:hypothetical protein